MFGTQYIGDQLVNRRNHWRSKRDPRAKQGFGWGNEVR